MTHPLISTLLEKLPNFQNKTTKILKALTFACDKITCLNFLAPLLLRIYLVPIFWVAGATKFASFNETVEWFGNSDWGLGLPLPILFVILVAGVEIFGAIFLFFGLGVRLISIPLMITMIIAGITVHLQYGWLAIATENGFFATERTIAAIERLNKAKDILKQYGNYEWLTENGNLVILNNGIEFSATYFIMLLVLFFMGAGRYVSIDYWLRRQFIQ